MLLLIILVVTLLMLLAITLPFFLGGTTQLAAAAALNDRAKLDALRQEIISRYLTDEAAWQQGLLNTRTWHKRRTFLTNSYIDVCRRHDYLTAMTDAR